MLAGKNLNFSYSDAIFAKDTFKTFFRHCLKNLPSFFIIHSDGNSLALEGRKEPVVRSDEKVYDPLTDLSH